MSVQHDANEAFREGLVALIPQLRAFGRTLSGHAGLGDDLAQEALSKALSAQHSYTPGTNLKGWVFMILRNQFYGEMRRSWRSVPLVQDVVEQTLVANTNPTAGLELDELRRALMLLPDEQREALILIGAGGFSYEEVAEMTGCAAGTIKSRVSRARDRVALIFAEGSFARDGGRPSEAMANILSQLRAAERPKIAA
ncbi:sigma-70 family RNA polymerase sigma factor [Phenylobacterium sp.]|uniref:sigma-70 family RNA polymerase sigma factor n=1 Tax=Phenylobacterium sp. TaxID=1871053 RepID=UPI002F401161